MPRPRSISLSALALAALAVIDRHGLQGLSMRSVAAELGMSAMSLYRYVDGREQIELLVVELVLSRIPLTHAPDQNWRTRISALCCRIRDSVGAHPAIVPLLLVHRQTTQASHRIGEALLSALADAGFGGEHRVIAFRALLSYVIGALQAEHLAALSDAGTSALASLPATEYPNLAATAKCAQSLPVEVEFTEGLNIVLDGLESQVSGTA